MCSVSKQFTGFCIALLAQQGKLHIDSDVHLYLPWLPYFHQKITVRNLLNHTSGIRDGITLAGIAGIPLDGVLTQDVALKLIKSQRTLNFIPGEKFSYSNSNYILLAEIVKTVSGESFEEFTAAHIFKPLGMAGSHFVGSSEMIIANRASSYNNGKNSLQNVYTLGDGGLFTNMEDMAPLGGKLLPSQDRRYNNDPSFNHEGQTQWW